MPLPRLEFIYHPCGYIEEVCALQRRVPQMYHAIASFTFAQMRHQVICLWLSSVVVYEPQMTLPRLELIYCPNRYIEEICRLQFASTRMNCTIQTLNASKIGYQIWSKLSIFVVVWSIIVKKGTKVDILSSWIYRRGLNTSTSYSTRELHNMMLNLYPDDSGLIWWSMNCLFHCHSAIFLETPST